MKILHCIAQLPGKTGSGVYYQQLAEGLKNLGYHNALLYASQDGEDLNLPQDNDLYPLAFKTEALPFPIPGMSDEMPYESTVYSQMTKGQLKVWAGTFRKKLEEIKQDFQPDLIISHHIFLLTSLVRKVFEDRPVIGISHGTDIRQVRMHPEFLDDHLANVNQLDAYFALSPSDAKRLSEIFNIPIERITVTGGGFDEDIFKPDSEHDIFDGTYRLIFSGKVSHAKGIYELARAFPKILEEVPNSELLIVGNASEEQKGRILKRADYSDKIKFTPAVNQASYANYLQKADIYVLPSYYEGIALSSIEALATRTRVVMSENDNLSWLLGNVVNKSGVIEYIQLPRLKNVDTPIEEDIPAFVDRIAEACLLQIKRMEANRQQNKNVWDLVLSQEIASHSWQGIIDEIALTIQGFI